MMGLIFMVAGGGALRRVWIPSSSVPMAGVESVETKQVQLRVFDKNLLKKDVSNGTYIVFLIAGLVVVIFGVYVWSLFVILFASIFICLGGGSLVYKILIGKQNEVLKRTGRKIVTTVSEIESTGSSMGSRRHHIYGRKIVTVLPDSGGSVSFRSNTYYVEDLDLYIRKGDKIDVYVDPANPKKYFVDVESLTPGK